MSHKGVRHDAAEDEEEEFDEGCSCNCSGNCNRDDIISPLGPP